ncbi:MAG: hypothetical protein ABFD13_06510 [Candidatus Cryosericum sp.]|nr:hypothetical protein [bacterium]
MKLYRSPSSYRTAPRPVKSTGGVRYRARSRYKTGRSSRMNRGGASWRTSEELEKAKRGLPVFLTLCVVLGLVLPIFFGQVGRAAAPQGETVVLVQATLNGKPWSGRLAFRLNGATQWTGSMVPYEVFALPGVYGLAVTGGGPAGAKMLGVTPTGSVLGRPGETITFTVEFTGQ